ncbi:uncharacterized protein LOC118757269, partial [Rhagoletis pomonella]|uniref:uncharacterized protein LOC118757269 n=1 Tax=Rhagoletis pomonella TaxID=28610 RepID=UPI00178516C5
MVQLSAAASSHDVMRSAPTYSAALINSTIVLSSASVSTRAPSSSLLSCTQQAASPNLCNGSTATTPSLGTSTTPTQSVPTDTNTVNPAPVSTQQPNEWKTVSNSRRPKLTKPLIIGSNNNQELSVISQQKWLHVASFSTNVTAA